MTATAATSVPAATMSRIGSSRHTSMIARSIGPFTKDAVFGALVVTRLRHCRRVGAMSPAVKPVGKPDARKPHVRFDERGGETDCTRSTAPLLDSTDNVLGAPYPDRLLSHGRLPLRRSPWGASIHHRRVGGLLPGPHLRQVLRAMRCKNGCGGRMLAAWRETAPTSVKRSTAW